MSFLKCQAQSALAAGAPNLELISLAQFHINTPRNDVNQMSHIFPFWSPAQACMSSRKLIAPYEL